MKKNIFFIWILLVYIIANTSICFAQYDNGLDQSSPDNILKDFSALRKKVKKNPRDVVSLNSLGIIYARTGKLNEAIKLWNYAVGIDPKYVHLYNNLGSALKQQKKYDQARLIFKTGLIYSQSYWIYYNLGLLEREDGNLGAAIEAFRNCLTINPEFRPAKMQLENLGYCIDAGLVPPEQLAKIGLKQPVNFSNLFSTHNKFSFSFGGKKQNKSVPQNVKKLSLNECIEIINSIEAQPNEKYVVLTFDDGPHSTNTYELLKVLKEEGAKATFFVVGNRAETYPDIVAQIAAEGHEVGNHSWNHKSLVKSSLDEGEASIHKTNEIICGITGKPCSIVRPPYGASNKNIRAMFAQQGWHEIMWDVDTRDWDNKDPDVITWRIMKTFTPGSIILMHDIHPYAYTAMPKVIKAFKACGYSFLTVSEMIKLNNKKSELVSSITKSINTVSAQ